MSSVAVSEARAPVVEVEGDICRLFHRRYFQRWCLSDGAVEADGRTIVLKEACHLVGARLVEKDLYGSLGVLSFVSAKYQ